jgi:hypothetical protein
MRYLKIFGLAAIATVVAMAFIANSASATALCSVNETKCATPLGAGTVIEAHLKTGTKAVLETSLATVECSKSATKGKTTTGAAEAVKGVIEELNFEECQTSTGETKCTVGSALNLPYNGSIVALGGGNGKLTVTKGTGGGNPGATVTCLGVIECTFRTPSAVLKVFGGNPAVAKAEAITLSEHSVGLKCPAPETTAKWTAEYEVLKPNPLFISELP